MQEFTVAQGARLVVAVPSAHVTVSASSSPGRIGVRVAPANPARNQDHRTAERITVTGEKDLVTVYAPTAGLFGLTLGTALVDVEVPEGTPVELRTSNGSVRLDGPAGDVQLHSSNGSVRVDHARTLRASTSNGPVWAGTVEGGAELSSSSGEVRLDRAGARSSLKSSNGALSIGVVDGPLTAKTSNGSITLARLDGEARLRTSNGAIRVERVLGGSLEASTSLGEIEIGVEDGVSVWVDAHTKAGTVLNELRPSEAPASERTAELRASTSMGAIRLRRLQAGAA